ncbi:hypothetical protein K431DRAFT_336667 [Polychaeton citri CBS 116435]|uniref:Uncharacterized protein n=1 Tax=Polychaeton citri CBS 116435 TaxID=1314669 RepID=A0A9P4UU53_9PEZI|nr:hypothetical protein K431DRAFT_336667 [Polychaeton citri CBS 116435]
MAAAAVSPQPAASAAGGLLRWTPSLPTNVISMFNPFGGDEPQKKPTEEIKEKRRPMLATVLPASGSSESPPSPSRSVMFAEPDTRSNSDIGSIHSSTTSCNGKKTRKGSSARQKTCFSICHPPPASHARQKLHRRPRSLLQLHKVTTGARPVPAFEVIPSANFSVRLTRATTRVFRAKHSLCPNDLVVLKAENYGGEEDEEQEARDIIALICKGRKEDGTEGKKAKICFHDGTEWEAYATVKGGYEFFTTDQHGLSLTVRWVPKRTNRDDPKAKPKFNFSTISPNSRRHPVIATLSKTGLDINDTYRVPDPKALTPLSTPLQDTFLAQRVKEDEDDDSGVEEQHNELCETDDRLRQIIAISGIWVAFKEGWSPSFKFDDDARLSCMLRSPSLRETPSRNAASPSATPPGSPGMTAVDKRGSIRSIGSGIARRSSLLSRSNRNSNISLHSNEEHPGNEGTAAHRAGGRARGDSTSTVLVHRAASNRRRNHSQAAWRPDLLQAPSQVLNEASREDLSSSDSKIATSSEQETMFDKRESTATTETKASSACDDPPPARKPAPSAATLSKAATPKASKKPKKGLRKLWCFGKE